MFLKPHLASCGQRCHRAGCLQTPLSHIKKEFPFVAATKPAAGNKTVELRGCGGGRWEWAIGWSTPYTNNSFKSPPDGSWHRERGGSEEREAALQTLTIYSVKEGTFDWWSWWWRQASLSGKMWGGDITRPLCLFSCARDGRAFSNKLVPALTSEKKLAQKSCALFLLYLGFRWWRICL